MAPRPGRGCLLITYGRILSIHLKARDVATRSKHYHSTLYTVLLDCVYTVESRELTCRDMPAPRQAHQAGNVEQAQANAATYTSGEAITVYYNPADAGQARLEESGPNGMFWIGLVGGPLLILSGIGLGFWCFHDWRRARSA